MFYAVEGIGDLTGSSGILGFILGGGLLTVVIGAYRFFVNYRNTERGWAKARIDDAKAAQTVANRERTHAIEEARAWQGRCADLEYLLRSSGIPVPALSPELVRYLQSDDESQGGDKPRRTGSGNEKKR